MRSINDVLKALDSVRVASSQDAREGGFVVEELAAADLEVLAAPQRFNRLEQFPGCPPVPVTLADVLRISPREARRRIRDAEQLAPRTP